MRTINNGYSRAKTTTFLCDIHNEAIESRYEDFINDDEDHDDFLNLNNSYPEGDDILMYMKAPESSPLFRFEDVVFRTKSKKKQPHPNRRKITTSKPTITKRIGCSLEKIDSMNVQTQQDKDHDEEDHNEIQSNSEQEQNSLGLKKKKALHTSVCCSSFQLSHVEPKSMESTTIVCEKSRVAMLVMWSIEYTEVATIDVIPLINCSQNNINTKDLLEVADSLTSFLENKFESSSIGMICHDCRHHNDQIINKLHDECRCFVTSMIDELSQRLSQRMQELYNRRTNIGSGEIIRKALRLSNINYDRSLDHLDFYNQVERQDLEKTIDAGNEVLQARDSLVQEEEEEESSSCPICFDTFEGSEMKLTQCGHKVCASCWKGLLYSAASSGDTTIRCPHYKCRNVLGIRDIAHILFNNNSPLCVTSCEQQDKANDRLNRTNALMKLVKFRTEQYLIDCPDTNFQFCSTPKCGKIFTENMVVEEGQEQPSSSKGCCNVSVCDCGVCVCTKCKEVGSAHLGLTCEEYKKIREEMDSGRVDAEYKSIQWMSQNAKPCPKCNFPINKNGGCNHVHCTKCSYYFCWICNGPGDRCGSYRCLNERNLDKVAEFQSSIDSASGKMVKQINQLIDLVKEESALKENINMNCEENKLEIQVQQLLVWCRSYLAVHSNQKKSSPIHRIVEVCKHIVYSLNVKDLPDPSITIERLAKGQLDALDSLKKEQSPKKAITKRKRQALERLEKKKETRPIGGSAEKTMEDVIKVSQLCSLPSKKFALQIKAEISHGVKKLVNEARYSNQQKNEDNRSEKVITPIASAVLNKKEKPSRASWKNSSKLSNLDGENSSECKQGISEHGEIRILKIRNQMEKKQPWKGRSRVKARRSIVLSQWDSELF